MKLSDLERRATTKKKIQTERKVRNALQTGSKVAGKFGIFRNRYTPWNLLTPKEKKMRMNRLKRELGPKEEDESE